MRLPAFNRFGFAIAALAVATLGLAACKTPPRPEPFAAGGEQPVLASAQNWRELAGVTAATLRPALPRGPVEVQIVTGQSPFEASFARLLATALAERGVRVAGVSPGGAGAGAAVSPWIVRIDAEDIPHQDVLRFYSDELVVSTRLLHAGVQVAGRDATYYVARSERRNYEQPPAAADKPVYSVRF